MIGPGGWSGERSSCLKAGWSLSFKFYFFWSQPDEIGNSIKQPAGARSQGSIDVFFN